MKDKRSFLTVLILLLSGTLLFTYTATKAYLISITHDEGQTFLHFVRYNQWWFGEYSGISANNHPLNSLLMILSSKLFGTGEFALRLPNVLAHAGYLFFTGLLVLRYRNIILTVSAFLLLNSNPFMLDFFSLARGYGISMCFLAGSLYYLSKALTSEELSMRNEILSLLLALTGVLANFTLLNYMLAASGALLLLVAWRSALFSKQWMLHTIMIITIMGLTMVFFIPVIDNLKQAGTLFYGGDNGFWTDTVNSLILFSFRKAWLFEYAKGFILAILIIAGIILLAIRVRRKLPKEYIMLPTMLLILSLCMASVVAQHHLMGTKFLLNRTALFFIPLFMLLVCEILFILWQLRFLRWAAPMVSLAFVLHCASLIDFRSVAIWEQDADTKDLIAMIEAEHGSPGAKETVTIGTEFIYEPALTYYKITRKLSWINKVNLKPEYREYMDYCILTKTGAPVTGMRLLKDFPYNSSLFTNTVSTEWTAISSSIQRFEKDDVKNGDTTVTSEKYSYNGGSSGVLNKDGSSLILEDTLTAAETGSIVRIHVQAMILMENLNDNVHLVASSQSPKETISWEHLAIRDHVNETGKWVELNWVEFIPRPWVDNLLRVYFIGNQDSKVYFDDLKVTVYTIKNDHKSAIRL